jgi:hypothetical protein
MIVPLPRVVAAARRAAARFSRALPIGLLIPAAALAQPLTFDVQVVDDPADSTSNFGQHAALAVHPRNFIVHVVYYDSAKGDLRHAVNEGAGWSRRTIDSGGDVGRHAAIAIDRQGVLHVAYYDATNGALKYARKDGAAWTTHTVTTTGDVGRHAAIALNALSQPVITFFDTDDGLFLAHSPSASYGSWQISRCCDVRTLGRAPVTAARVPFRVVYADGLANALLSRTFDPNAASSSAWGQPETVANGQGIEFISLAGNVPLHVSYTAVDTSLFSLHWVWHDGNGWRPAVRIATGVHGALAVDSTRQPSIAFQLPSFSAATSELLYGRFRNDAWRFQPIEASANVGQFASLAFDLCDDPHVAYYDDTHDRLKYATAMVPGGCHEHLVDNADGTVTDTATGLMWLKDANFVAATDPANGGMMSWSGAVAWANGLSHAGHDDWRLPATAEPDPTCDSQAVFTQDTARVVKGCARSELGHLRWIDGVHPRTPGPFVNLQGRGTYYWSGTTWARAIPPGSRAWAHAFFHGEQGPAVVSANPYAYGWAVREVREGTTGAATGSGPVSVTTSAGRLLDLRAIAEASLPSAGKPVGVTFPHGFLGWRITSIDTGATVTVTIIYPAPVVAVSYWKVIAGTWMDLTSLIGSNDGDATITLTITDGALGDADGVANGTIVDPGGIGRQIFRLVTPRGAILAGVAGVILIFVIAASVRGTWPL